MRFLTLVLLLFSGVLLAQQTGETKLHEAQIRAGSENQILQTIDGEIKHKSVDIEWNPFFQWLKVLGDSTILPNGNDKYEVSAPITLNTPPGAYYVNGGSNEQDKYLRIKIPLENRRQDRVSFSLDIDVFASQANGVPGTQRLVIHGMAQAGTPTIIGYTSTDGSREPELRAYYPDRDSSLYLFLGDGTEDYRRAAIQVQRAVFSVPEFYNTSYQDYTYGWEVGLADTIDRLTTIGPIAPVITRLELDGDDLSIPGTPSVDLSEYSQDLSLSGDSLLISRGLGIKMPEYSVATIGDLVKLRPLAGSLIRTEGYAAANDGGGADYYVYDTSPFPGYSGQGVRPLPNGKVAVYGGYYMNVMSFGATGDSLDTAHDQVADAVAFGKIADRRSLYFPIGMYRYESTSQGDITVLDDYWTVEGESQYLSVVFRTGGSGRETINADYTKGFTVRNMTFLGDPTVNFVRVIRFNGATDITITNCNFGRNGFTLGGNALAAQMEWRGIRNLKVRDCNFDAVQVKLSGQFGLGCRYVWITGCYFKNVTDFAISAVSDSPLENMQDIFIFNNTIDGGTGAGLLFFGKDGPERVESDTCRNLIVESNTLYGYRDPQNNSNGQAAINMVGMSRYNENIVFRNNHIDLRGHPNTRGLVFGGQGKTSKFIRIENNTWISDATGKDIEFRAGNCIGCSIDGNFHQDGRNVKVVFDTIVPTFSIRNNQYHASQQLNIETSNVANVEKLFIEGNVWTDTENFKDAIEVITEVGTSLEMIVRRNTADVTGADFIDFSQSNGTVTGISDENATNLPESSAYSSVPTGFALGANYYNYNYTSISEGRRQTFNNRVDFDSSAFFNADFVAFGEAIFQEEVDINADLRVNRIIASTFRFRSSPSASNGLRFTPNSALIEPEGRGLRLANDDAVPVVSYDRFALPGAIDISETETIVSGVRNPTNGLLGRLDTALYNIYDLISAGTTGDNMGNNDAEGNEVTNAAAATTPTALITLQQLLDSLDRFKPITQTIVTPTTRTSSSVLIFDSLEFKGLNAATYEVDMLLNYESDETTGGLSWQFNVTNLVAAQSGYVRSNSSNNESYPWTLNTIDGVENPNKIHQVILRGNLVVSANGSDFTFRFGTNGNGDVTLLPGSWVTLSRKL